MPLPTRAPLLLALLWTAACSGGGSPPPEGGATRADSTPPASAPAEPTPAASGEGYSDPAVPIQAAPGDTFAVVLRSNATTGYQWALADSLAPGVLRLLGSRYEPPPAPEGSPPVAGAGGQERWTFRAEGAGEAAIALVYTQPWDSTPPADTTRFRVVVRASSP